MEPLSYVTPRILVVGLTGICCPNNVIMGSELYSLLKGVVSVNDDLGADTAILFAVSQSSNGGSASCSLSLLRDRLLDLVPRE